jgi:peptide/nickel transport system ATP-binding protein
MTIAFAEQKSALTPAPAAPPASTTSGLASRPDLLHVNELRVRFGSEERPLEAVDRASFSVAPGETVCLVGESGSGKTITALSILRLEEQKHARIVGGQIAFDGQGLVGLGRGELDQLRGRRIAMIFQEPMTAFDPVFSIGDQIVETILRHERVSRTAAQARAISLLSRVHIPDPALRMRQIPEELSGGMRQRAMIAMALACNPDLLIADEPTTALDVTIQAQILTLLKELQRETGMAILLITHDLGVAAEMADRVVVMYAGRIAEHGPAAQIFSDPAHPYTRGLLRSAIPLDSARGSELVAIKGSIPRLDELPSGCRFHPRCAVALPRCAADSPVLQVTGERAVACFRAEEPDVYLGELTVRAHASATAPGGRAVGPAETGAALVEARDVSKLFTLRSAWFAKNQRVQALDRVSLRVRRGETFGLVGESGCGKSTLGRVLLQLERPSSGHVLFDGQDVAALRGDERRRVRREMQMVFQDPYGSIDPRWSVERVIAEPLMAHARPDKATLRARVAELLELVGLDPSAAGRYPHEFSGGQRQRIGIARAIALNPRFIVADEAVSALDLSVQAQIVNLLLKLRDLLGLTSLFIGHGLNVVRHVSDRIGVMYLGRIVEVASADALFAQPLHHYSRTLLAAIPTTDPAQRRTLSAPFGELPSPAAPPSGCHFHPRCLAATERCRREPPPLVQLETERLVACHHPVGS